jgi:hypothetical protein
MNYTTSTNDLKQNKANHSLADALNELATEKATILKELQKDAIPLDVLPAQFQELIKQLEQRYKFPADYSLLYILFAFSIAIGNNYRIRVKRNWIEPAILYLSLIALAGQTKTPVQLFFMQPFKEWDKTNFEDYADNIQTYEAAKQAATKGNPCTDQKPTRLQLLLQDYTPEALVKVLSDNWHGVGVMMDELAGFIQNWNRYNNGNEMPMWLSFYNAQAFSSNRKTSHDSYVAHPFVSVIGGIQPVIMKKIFAGDMQINGMIDRFLFVYNVIVRKEVPGDDELDTYLKDAYTDAVKFLLAIQPEISDKDGKNIPRLLDLTAEAKSLLFGYLRANADKVNELNDEGAERLAGMYSKFDYHVIRLSFILQVLTNACKCEAPTEVTADAVRGGIRLADYFKQHTNRVHGLISSDPLAAYDETKKALYNQLPDGEFPFSDAIAIAATIRKNEVQAGKIRPDAVEKWVQRFLQNTGLFNQPKTGYYIKKSILKT